MNPPATPSNLSSVSISSANLSSLAIISASKSFSIPYTLGFRFRYKFSKKIFCRQRKTPRPCAAAGGIFLLVVVFLIVLADDEFKRRALETETFAQSVFDKAQIRKVQQFRLVDEDDKARRVNVGLRHEENFNSLALFRRRRIDGNGIANQFV